jgi:hypothetical protein
MNRLQTLAIVALVLITIVNLNAGETAAQTPQVPKVDIQERVKAARALLARAPVLKPLPANSLSNDEFIALARTTVEGQSRWILQGTPLDVDTIKSVETAINSLEEIIKLTTPVGNASDPPPPGSRSIASITSSPDHLPVRYRRTVDHLRNIGVFRSTTTNASPDVELAMWTFLLRRPNGTEEERTVDCTKNCSVPF